MPTAGRRRPRSPAARRFRRPGSPLWGLALTGAAVALLLAQYAPAAPLLGAGSGGPATPGPAYALKAPFPGNSSSVNSTTQPTCLAKKAYPLYAAFNATTGALRMAATTLSWGSGTVCTSTSYAQDFLTFWAPSFVSPSSGAQVLRSDWWLEWTANLSLVQPGYSFDGVSVGLDIDEVLYDNTTGVVWAPTGAFVYAFSHALTTAGYWNGSLNRSESLPLAVVLTAGDTYTLEWTAYLTLDDTARGGVATRGFGQMLVGVSGAAATLTGISIP